MAGFNFVVTRTKSNEVAGFHNICRHRAFPVVQKPDGNARIFSCHYHGWSYDLEGNLSKAPSFNAQATPSFDPGRIKLPPIHTHVDANGFVYGNLDAESIPEISWKQQYGDLDQQGVLLASGIDWSRIEHDHSWTRDEDFNWKVMQENFNECYHCFTSHKALIKTTDVNTYFVERGGNGHYIAHYYEPKSTTTTTHVDAGRFRGASVSYVFPISQFSPNPGFGFMHLMRSMPTSATTTRQEYDVYRLNTPQGMDELFEETLQFYKRLMQEDIDLCVGVQKNMERRVFDSGPLHPFREEGVIAFQDMVRQAMRTQVDREAKAGKELWPASASQSCVLQGGLFSW